MNLCEIIKKLKLKEGIYSKKEYNKINNLRIAKTIEKGRIDFDKIYFLNDKPLIIFKEFKDDFTEKEVNIVLEQIWSLDEVPLFFAIMPDRIRIYNSFFFDKKDPIKIEEKMEKINDILEDFKYENLLTRNFLRNKNLKFNKKVRLSKYLKDNLVELISKLEEMGLERKIINDFLLKCFFSKCFIDRYERFRGKIKEDYHVDSFEKLLLKVDNLYDFFEKLHNDYNGDIFKIGIDEKNQINKKHLKLVSNFYKGYNLKTGDSVLFNPYNFSIIPVSLVSDIYQTVLGDEGKQKNKSFYTPLMLVDNLLTKYKSTINEKTKVLDPSCGSGIFLVEILRIKLGKIKEINKDSIEKTLKTIYGFDIDEKAIKITCFSLYVVILDYVKTLNSFKFDNLINKTLFEVDFFDEGKFSQMPQFDLIVGNPPWGNPKDQTKYIDYANKNNLPISD